MTRRCWQSPHTADPGDHWQLEPSPTGCRPQSEQTQQFWGEAEMCQGVQWGAGTLCPRARAGHTLHLQEPVGRPWVAGSVQKGW